jgi:hypothetical protein
MNQMPYSSYYSPRGTSFGFNQPAENFYYNPSVYRYTVSPEGQIIGQVRPGATGRASGSGDYLSTTPSRPMPSFSPPPPPEKPTPRLIPSEQRAIRQSAALRGFSSRLGPASISSKIMSDTEKRMMEDQEQRIRDSIISEMLSRYMSPSRRLDYGGQQDLAGQREMLERMYGGGVA